MILVPSALQIILQKYQCTEFSFLPFYSAFRVAHGKHSFCLPCPLLPSLLRITLSHRSSRVTLAQPPPAQLFLNTSRGTLGAWSHHAGLEQFPGNKMALKMQLPAGAFLLEPSGT